jgi:hypothetical protein
MMVWIRCPERGRAVPTGIDVHPTCFAMLPDTIAGFTCSACGGRHEWHRRDAWLAESYPLLADRRSLNDGVATHYRSRSAADQANRVRTASWSIN